MSEALELVSELRQAGATFEPRGETLHVEAPRGVLTPDVVAKLRERKAELMAWLSEDQPQAVVAYRLAEAPHLRPLVIGGPGETADDVIDALRARYGERLMDARPYRSETP